MQSSPDQHNAALAAALHIIVQHASAETDQWVLLESLCLATGKLHGRSASETAIYVETIAERFVARDHDQ